MTPLRYTRQQLADALQATIAQDEDGSWWAHSNGFAYCGPFHWVPVQPIDDLTAINTRLIQITDPPTDWRESLTPHRTEAEPEVCEWRWNAAANRGYGGWFGYCGAKRGHNESVPDYCDCSRPIRIVEGAEHG